MNRSDTDKEVENDFANTIETNKMIIKKGNSKLDQLKIDQTLEDSIFKTIKAISFNYGLKFHDFYDLIQNDNIPRFGMHFFQISSIKPVFLLLHVPENKKKLPSITVIVSRIFLFLSIICDLKIKIEKINLNI